MTGSDHQAATTPRAFGDALRRTREAADISLEFVAAETKISPGILQALESGRFDMVPERVFCRNFVRQICELADTDAAEMLEAFDAAWERHLLASGAYQAVEEQPDEPGATIRWSFWLPVAAGAVILIGLAAFIVGGSPGTEPLPPDPRRSVATQPTPTFGVPATAAPSRNPPAVATPASRLAFAVEVVEDQECWIHLRDGLGEQDQRLLAGGSRLELELTGPVKLTVGNAAAVALVVGDRRYDQLGRPGQVVHAELSEDGLQMLGPREVSR